MLEKKQKNVLFLLEYWATKHPFPTAMSIFSAWDRSIFSMLGQPSLFVAKPASAFFFSLPLGCLSHCCSSDVAAWVCRGGGWPGDAECIRSTYHSCLRQRFLVSYLIVLGVYLRVGICTLLIYSVSFGRSQNVYRDVYPW